MTRFSLALITIAAIFGISNAAPFSLSSSLSTFNPRTNANPFISKEKSHLTKVLSLRGGEVLEPSTLEDMDGIIMKAAAEGKLIVIDFTAVWCGPCKMIAPIFKELSEEMDNIVFVKVDVDQNSETAAKYSVSAMPTFIFIKKGEVVDKLMGANPVKLKEMLEDLA